MQPSGNGGVDGEGGTRLATLGGFGAILLWSTTVALARSLSEALGAVSAAAAVYGVGGTLALVSLAQSRQRRRRIRDLPLLYVAGCGGLFVTYMLVLFLALGWASDRQQVLEIGLLNYLWPALTLLLSIVLLRKRAGWMLLPGTALALFGEFLVLTQGADVSWSSFLGNLASNPVAYALGLAAAVSWGLYSALTRRWAGGRAAGGVDVFLPVTALVLAAVALFVDEPRVWSPRSAAEALFLGGATYAAYGLWDTAMRRGNVVLVAAGSYMTPLLSTMVTVAYLGVFPGKSLWLGCVALIAGSVISARSVKEPL